MLSLLLHLASLLAAASCAGNLSSTRDDLVELDLLNIMPFPDSRPDAGWDRAFELIPAAQIAQEQINNASNLLQGYKLELITVQSEPCGISSISDGLVNTFEKILDPKRSLNVVGLSGLFCSSVTNTLSPLFSIPSVTYLQVAGSTTPEHRNSTNFPWLVHLISSSSVFNDAVLGMMESFGWQRIGLVYDELGIFFSGIAREFANREVFRGDLTLTSNLPITEKTLANDLVFPSLIRQGTRVILVVASIPESVGIMCSAYKRNATYPGYVYIFQSRTRNEFTSNVNLTDCTLEEMEQVIEGVFLINYDGVAERNTTLVSGMTYEEYFKVYSSRVASTASTYNLTLSDDNIYANVMYDEVWAFALALNASIPELQGVVNLESVTLQQSAKLAEILRTAIANVSFQGASGFIKFDPNRDDNSEINIFQVINGSQVIIGTYNADQGSNITFLRNVTPPGDTFERRTITLPQWLSYSFAVLTSFCFVFTTVILLILLWFRNRPEVKASSLYLNLLIFAGCYATYIAAEMRTVSRGVVISNGHLFTLVCNLEVWFGSIGMNLIFSTLLVRLFRIRYIFHKKYGKRSKYLEDHYLFLMVLFLCGVGVAILIPWTIVDKIRKTTTENYISDAKPPHFEVHSICHSDNLGIWLAASFSYLGIIIALVVFMAIQTRKIKLSNFKDTKKVNAYVAFTVITICILVPLWFVTDIAIGNDIVGHVFLGLAFVAVGFYCQLYIFVPQVVLTIKNRNKEVKKRSSGVPEYKIRPRETQFSKL